MGELWKLLGAADALGLVRDFTALTRASLIRDLKDSGRYKDLAPTWEEFCERYLPWSRRTADDDIRILDTLGEEFLLAADRLGLGRRKLLALTAAPPKLLPRIEGNEIIIDDERVQLDQRDRVVELLEELVAGQDQLRERIDRGEEQLKEREAELRDAREELQRLEEEEAGRTLGNFERHMMRALRALADACDYLSHADASERPEPKTVLRYFQALGQHTSELAHYGGGYVTPGWMQDEASFEKHMQEQAAAADPRNDHRDDDDEELL